MLDLGDDVHEFDQAFALFLRGDCRLRADRPLEAIADYSVMLAMNDEIVPPTQRIQALSIRGQWREQNEDVQGAVEDYDSLLAYDQAVQPKLRAVTLLNRGRCKVQANHLWSAINDYDSLLLEPDITPDQRAEALYCRGVCKIDEGDREGRGHGRP